MQRIIIFANGELPNLNNTRAILRDDDFIICADGGVRHASALDLKPDLIIGDMDSIDRALLQKLQDEDIPIELFPRDKDETDLELAIKFAIGLEPKKIVIVAALGGRIDHTLGNIALLTDSRLAKFDIRFDDGTQEIFICIDQVEVHGNTGDIVSLIPWGKPVRQIQTRGLRWVLNDETLYPEKTRGISNEMLSNSAVVKIKSGNLLVVHTRKIN
jgi:thiamine pyrophosphokinase